MGSKIPEKIKDKALMAHEKDLDRRGVLDWLRALIFSTLFWWCKWISTSSRLVGIDFF